MLLLQEGSLSEATTVTESLLPLFTLRGAPPHPTRSQDRNGFPRPENLRPRSFSNFTEVLGCIYYISGITSGLATPLVLCFDNSARASSHGP